MLTIDHLEKCFGSTVLFRDLTFTVDGPAVLWAPSGWGKTTLLRILMGLEEPTSGIVQGVGRMAAVFQEDRLCPQLTAVQNVTLVLPGSAEQYKEQIIKDFQQLGMDAAALALPAARLSGGQKRRTALLRALWAASDTLLLDEPFSALDYQTRLSVCDDVYKIIRSEHKTAVLITHDISEAVSVADKIVVLSRRPARVVSRHTLSFPENEPLKRRENKEFSTWFELLWRELNA